MAVYRAFYRAVVVWPSSSSSLVLAFVFELEFAFEFELVFESAFFFEFVFFSCSPSPFAYTASKIR